MIVLQQNLFLYQDCGQPAAGYKVSDTTFTGNSVSVACDDAIGYVGTSTPNSLTCLTTGWDQTSYSGCSLKGIYSSIISEYFYIYD